MGTAVAKRTAVALKLQPIEKVAVQIRAHLYDADKAECRCINLRLKAGQKLLELRERIELKKELGEVNWWEWCETNIQRSRKDCERLMRIAGADDPEAALEAERAKDRDRKRLARSDGADVRSIEDEADESAVPVEDQLTPAEQAEIAQSAWRRGFMHRAEEAARLPWWPATHMPDWPQFEVDAEMVEAAKNAAGAWRDATECPEKLRYYRERKLAAELSPPQPQPDPGYLPGRGGAGLGPEPPQAHAMTAEQQRKYLNSLRCHGYIGNAARQADVSEAEVKAERKRNPEFDNAVRFFSVRAKSISGACSFVEQKEAGEAYLAKLERSWPNGAASHR